MHARRVDRAARRGGGVTLMAVMVLSTPSVKDDDGDERSPIQLDALRARFVSSSSTLLLLVVVVVVIIIIYKELTETTSFSATRTVSDKKKGKKESNQDGSVSIDEYSAQT